MAADPFNMLWKGMKHDELKLERSFKNMRLDIMERLPAPEPRLLRNGGDMLVQRDYDVTRFHDDYVRALARRTAATTP